MSDETITIPMAKYNQLLYDSHCLNKIENSGVDNCDAWDFIEWPKREDYDLDPEDD